MPSLSLKFGRRRFIVGVSLAPVYDDRGRRRAMQPWKPDGLFVGVSDPQEFPITYRKLWSWVWRRPLVDLTLPDWERSHYVG